MFQFGGGAKPFVEREVFGAAFRVDTDGHKPCTDIGINVAKVVE